MNANDKQAFRAIGEVVVGLVIGLTLRKKMVDKGMIESFFKPNFLIRKPGTFKQV